MAISLAGRIEKVPDPSPDSLDLVMAGERCREVAELLVWLTAKQFESVWYFEVMGMTNKETARLMGGGEKQSKDARRYGRARLRRLVGAEHG